MAVPVVTPPGKPPFFNNELSGLVDDVAYYQGLVQDVAYYQAVACAEWTKASSCRCTLEESGDLRFHEVLATAEGYPTLIPLFDAYDRSWIEFGFSNPFKVSWVNYTHQVWGGYTLRIVSVLEQQVELWEMTGGGLVHYVKFFIDAVRRLYIAAERVYSQSCCNGYCLNTEECFCINH